MHSDGSFSRYVGLCQKNDKDLGVSLSTPESVNSEALKHFSAESFTERLSVVLCYPSTSAFLSSKSKSPLHETQEVVMPFTIQRLLVEDVPECVQMYFDSFQNSHSLACWPRVPAIRAFWEAMFINEMEEAASHFIKAVDSETGKLAAFCKWVEPKPGVWEDTSLPEWPKESNVDLCNETFGMWAKQHRDLMQDRGHWCTYPFLDKFPCIDPSISILTCIRRS